MDCNLSDSSITGFSRQEHWSELLGPPPGDLPNPEIEPEAPMSPARAGGFFTASTTWESLIYIYIYICVCVCVCVCVWQTLIKQNVFSKKDLVKAKL